MSKSSLFAYLQLTRPANVVTAIADIWAGFTISGGWLYYSMLKESGTDYHWFNFLLLSLSTIGLYAGGVAFNDIADAELDAVERPERPLPSGRASVSKATLMASGLLLFGIICAASVSVTSGILACGIAVFAVLYDYWGKHQNFLGPINMGLCRALNLLLGISAVPGSLQTYWPLGLIPLVYVAAITMISRGEVHGKNKKALYAGGAMYGSIFLAILALSFFGREPNWQVIPFLVLFGGMIFPPLIKAIRTQEPKFIGKSVKAAVISLIILNASLAAASLDWTIGVTVLLLLPISLWLAKKFAVT